MVNLDENAAQTRIVKELQELLAKSINADIQLLENGSKLLQQVAEGNISLSSVAEQGNELLRQAITDYVRMSTKHTSNLIDLSIDVSDNLVRRMINAPRKVQETAKQHPPLFELKMQGQPGTLCQTAFVLENSYTEEVIAKFKYPLLVNKVGDNSLDIPIGFDPPEVTLSPAQKQNIIVGIELPGGIKAGLYQTIISVESMPGLNFLLSLEVEEAMPQKSGRKAGSITRSKKKAASPKKRAKVATKKKVVKKKRVSKK